MNNFKKVALVTNEKEIWNKYKFLKNKIDIYEFEKEIYKKFDLSFSYDDNNFFQADCNLNFLKKLEIEGIKNQFVFDLYENFDNEIDYLIFFGLNNIKKSEINLIKSTKKKILYIGEPRAVDQISYDNKFHKYFDIIFSNDYSLVDNKKFFFSHGIHIVCKENKFILRNKKKKLICSFLSNRFNSGHLSTSVKKKNFIKIFSKNIPNDFDFYGLHWEIPIIYKSNIFYKILNKILFYIYKFKFYKNKIQSYKGSCEDKVKTCSAYKFELVMENSLAPYRNTDRIISTFFSGSVPLYYGPDTIYELIPSDCFVNVQKFNSIDDLINFLKKMDMNTYNQYLKSIEKFLNSENFFYFTADKTIKDFITELKKFN